MSAALESGLLANAADMQANMDMRANIGVLSQANRRCFRAPVVTCSQKQSSARALRVCVCVSTSIIRMYLGIYILTGRRSDPNAEECKEH